MFQVAWPLAEYIYTVHHIEVILPTTNAGIRGLLGSGYQLLTSLCSLGIWKPKLRTQVHSAVTAVL